MTDRRFLSQLAGIALGVATGVAYAVVGPKPAIPLLLVIAVITIALSLRGKPFSLPAITVTKKDLAVVVLLVVIMAPVYCWRLYSTPWQINTDEVTIMVAAKDALAVPHHDIFGLSNYAALPAAVFLVIGRLGEALGGIDLAHMRLVHGLLGIVCVLLAYAFFRQFMEPLKAGTIAALLGFNHSLFAISRMAMRENTSLLFELLAMTLLVRGIQRSSRATTFLGGVATGMAFYVYFPGRITLLIGLALLAAIYLLKPRRDVLRNVGGHTVIFLLGWAMIAAPVIASSSKSSKHAYEHARQQFLFYPEGRKEQQGWIQAKSPAEAWKANIWNGLATFNAKKIDQGNIYPNEGNGFVDPATGVLVWIGFVLILARTWRRRSSLLTEGDDGAVALGDLTALFGFLTLLLTLSFLVNKAPNYTRLLVILPYATYLVGAALWKGAELVTRSKVGVSGGERRNWLQPMVVMLVVAAIGLWNVRIFFDMVHVGRAKGNDVGSTGRYVAARSDLPSYTWILAADSTHAYYGWGGPAQWGHWMGFFAGPRQVVRVESVATVASVNVPPPFTVFIARPAWDQAEATFRERFPRYRIVSVTPDSRLLAIDVLGTR